MSLAKSVKVSRFEVERFDGKMNFGLWQVRMRDLLIHEGLHKTLKGKEAKPADMKDVDWEEQEEQACATIRLCLGQEILSHVDEAVSAKGLWDKLESLYKGKSFHTRLYYKRKMYNFRMQGNVSMNDHLNAFNQIVRDLTSFGEVLKDEDVAVALINSLGDKYEHLITTIVHGKDSIGYNEVSAALLEYASRRKLTDGGGNNVDASYLARGRSSSRNLGGGSRGKSQNRFRDVECYYCRQKGHIKPHCQKLKEKLKNDASGGDATIARFHEEEGEVYVVNDDGQAYQHGWIMDSACSVHICLHRNWFSSFRPVNKGVVKLGDDHPRKILGVGTVKIKLYDGTMKTLSGVRYVPGMSKNLISLPTLDRIGCRFSGCDGRLDVLRGALVVMRASLQGSLYCLHGNTVVGDLAVGVHGVWSKQTDDRKGQAKRVSFKVELGRAL